MSHQTTQPAQEVHVTRHRASDAQYEVYDFAIRNNGAADFTYRRRLDNASLRALENLLTDAAIRLTEYAKQMETAPAQPDEYTFDALGERLTQMLVPRKVRDYLAASNIPLIITTNDPGLPWHLLRFDGAFIGQRRPIGVRPMITQLDSMPHQQSAGACRALLIANPTGEMRGSELPHSLEEAHDIQRLLMVMNPAISVKPLENAAANLGNVQIELGLSYHIIHYAGHARFDRESGGRRGLVLFGSEHYSLHDIHTSPFPGTFVFCNACWGGAVKPTIRPNREELYMKEGLLDGFGIEFIRGGARTFIAPLWPVYDGYARDFARRFYEKATQGLPVGLALQETRNELLSEQPWNPTAAVYILYGDPRETLPGLVSPSYANPTVAVTQQSSPPANPQQGALVGAAPRSQAYPEPGNPRQLPPDPTMRASHPRDDASSGGQASTPQAAGHHVSLLSRLFLSEDHDEDSPFHFAPDACDLLLATISRSYQEQRNSLHSLDLLVSLVCTDICPAVREAISPYLAPDTLREFAYRRFQGDQETSEPGVLRVTDMFMAAIAEAKQFAAQDHSFEVAALDIARALLTFPKAATRKALRSIAQEDLLALRRTLFGDHDDADDDANQQASGKRHTMRQGDANQIGQHQPPASAGTPSVSPLLVGDDLRQMAKMGGLRYVYGWSERRAGTPFSPLPAATVERDGLLANLVRALQEPHDPHVLLTGEHGSGKWALVESLAYALNLAAHDGSYGHLRDCQLLALRKNTRSVRDTDMTPARLALAFLQQVTPGAETILVIQDFTRIVESATADERERFLAALHAAMNTRNLRVILTTADKAHLAGTLPPELLTRFAQQIVPAAQPGAVAAMIAGHIPWIERQTKEWVSIPADVQRAAAQARDGGPLVQPGLGLYLLRRATKQLHETLLQPGQHQGALTDTILDFGASQEKFTIPTYRASHIEPVLLTEQHLQEQLQLLRSQGPQF